jgi:hypothetical protein
MIYIYKFERKWFEFNLEELKIDWLYFKYEREIMEFNLNWFKLDW